MTVNRRRSRRSARESYEASAFASIGIEELPAELLPALEAGSATGHPCSQAREDMGRSRTAGGG
jgi:hypothetical protein